MHYPSDIVPVFRALTQLDAAGLTDLYNELTSGPKTARSEDVSAVMAHPGTVVFGAQTGDQIIGMVTLHILPNVTWGGRPYALIENVVVTAGWRGCGVGRRILQAEIDQAEHKNTYKIMLLTGNKRGAHGFYEALGFECDDKVGMVLRAP